MKDQIDSLNIPKHVAVIMDGNGRWAKNKGAARIFGHHHAVKAVRETTEAAAEIGVQYLTLYAFSTENWNRPKEEVDGLMELLVSTISSETKTLQKNQIRLQMIGDFAGLPVKCQKELQEAIDKTADNTQMTLILALNYSGRWDILNATQKIVEDVKRGDFVCEKLDESTFKSYLSTAQIPDPELLIRTSGEQRISNYLLWEIAYTELFITDTLWPDFRKEHFLEAIKAYQGRERRFGKTSEQLISKA